MSVIITTATTVDGVIDGFECFVATSPREPCRPLGNAKLLEGDIAEAVPKAKDEMRLLDSEAFDSGVTLLRYEPVAG